MIFINLFNVGPLNNKNKYSKKHDEEIYPPLGNCYTLILYFPYTPEFI